MKSLQAKRNQVHAWIDQADEAVVNALLERAMMTASKPYTPEMLAELDRRWENYVSGKTTPMSRDEMNERIEKVKSRPNA